MAFLALFIVQGLRNPAVEKEMTDALFAPKMNGKQAADIYCKDIVEESAKQECKKEAIKRFRSVKRGEFFSAYPILRQNIETRLKSFGLNLYVPFERYEEGSILGYPDKFDLLAEYVEDERVETVCEIGFNVGYSTMVYLLNNPKAKVFVFDVFLRNYTAAAVSSLQQMFPERDLLATAGDSATTVPRFHRLFPDIKCNLIFIDGSHYDPALAMDIEHMKSLANETYHRVLIDDVGDNTLHNTYRSFIVEFANNQTLNDYTGMKQQMELTANFRHHDYITMTASGGCFDWQLMEFPDNVLNNYAVFRHYECSSMIDGVTTYKGNSSVAVAEYIF